MEPHVQMGLGVARETVYSILELQRLQVNEINIFCYI